MLTFERLYWLAANAEKKQSGYVNYDARFRYALAALVLIELLLDKNIEWTSQKNLAGIPDNPPQDDLLREVWELCTIPKKVNWFLRIGKKQDVAIEIKDWLIVMIRGDVPKFLQRIKARLAEKNVLKTQQRRFLGIIKYKSSHITSDTDRQDYQTHLQNIVLGLAKPSIQEFVLLKVIKACKIHSVVYTSKKSKDQKEFLQKLTAWTTQKMDNEAITNLLETLDLERNLEALTDMLDTLVDTIDSIADATSDAGDGGDGGGD